MLLKRLDLWDFKVFTSFFRFFGRLCQGSYRVWKTWKTWKMGCFLKKVRENLEKWENLWWNLFESGTSRWNVFNRLLQIDDLTDTILFLPQSSYFCYYHLLGIGKCKVSLILVLIFCSQIPKLSPIWNEFIDSVKNCLE